MATQVQFRRGTTGENSSFTGAQGEVTVDITKNTTVVHDGSTLGGFPLLREDGTNMALSSGSLSSCALKFASDVDTGLIRPAENQIAIVTGGTAQLSIDSAGAATFNNNVLISGSLTVSGGISGPTYFSAGSAAAPSITFVGDLNTGIYSPGADQVAISTNGTGRLFVDASGRVGIGTSTPAATLTVIGGPSVDGSMFPSGNLIADFNSNVGDTELITFGNQSLNASTFTMAFVPRRAGSVGGQHGWYQKVDSTSSAAGSLEFGTLQRALSGGAPQTPRFYISSSGQVGIGTTSPAELLHVASGNILLSDGYDIKSPDNFAIYDTAGTRDRFGFSTSNTYNTRSGGAHIFQINNGESARIDSSGRLLVGTSANISSYKLQVVDTNPFDGLRYSATTGGPVARLAKSRSAVVGSYSPVLSGDTLGNFDFAGDDGSAFITGARIAAAVDGTPGTNDMPGRLVFSTTADGASSPTERLRITSAGLVGVGTNSPSQNLHVASTGNTKVLVSSSFSGSIDTGFLVDTTGDTSVGSLTFLKGGVSRGDIAYRHNASGGSERLGFSVAGGERLSVLGSGNVGIGTASPGAELEISSTDNTTDILISEGTSPSTNRIRNVSGILRLDADINNSGALASAIILGVDNTERARIDNSGRLLVGTSSARSNFFNSSSFAPLLQVEGTDANSARFSSVVYNGNDTNGPYYILGKTRAASVGGTTVVGANDGLGVVSFQGADGTELVQAAEIAAFVDGTPGANDMPGRLVFSTTADGASSPTERMRISNTGLHTINSTAHQGPALADASPAKLLLGTGTYTDTATAASGTVVHGPITTFDNPAIAATNATVTYTTASTVYIDGAPTAGTNVTITNPFALFVGSGQTSLPAGTVGLPSLTFGLNKTTGIYSPATNQVAFSTAGVQRLLVDATGNFNFDSNTLYVDGVNNRVGIGTASPGLQLDVSGAGGQAVRVATTDTSGVNVGRFIATYTGGGGGVNSTVDLRAGDGYSYLLNTTNTPLLIGTNNTERARIDSSGRLLVGTSADFKSTLLQVRGSATIGYAANDVFSEALFFTKTRATSPTTQTVVQSGDSLGLAIFQGSDGSAYRTAAQIEAAVDATPGLNDMPGRLTFSTTADGASTPTERMRISSYGRLYIDTNAHQGDALSDTAPAKILAGAGTYTDTLTAASGTVVHGPINTFDNPAIAATNTGVIYTTASTVYIDGAPTAGTNVTITNPFAFFIGAGQTSVPAGTVGLPSVVFGLNKTSGIYSPAANQIGFSISGTERARIDSSGSLLVGASTAPGSFFGTTPNRLAIAGVPTANLFAAYSNDVFGTRLDFLKSRSTTVGGLTIVQNNDELGVIYFGGTDGAAAIPSASIESRVDGIPGTNDIPGRLGFLTTADGASTPTERMRIGSDGRFVINSNAHQGAAITTTTPAKLNIGAGTYTDTTTAIGGTVAHGPLVTFRNPAIAATNTTVTYTTASTVYIEGAPTGGANVTITNPFALYINAGQSSFPLGNSALPSITFGTNKTTGIWSPATDTIAFTEGGTEAMRIDSSSRLLLGLTAARANFFNSTISPLHQQEGTTDQGRGAAIVSSSATAGSGAYLVLAHQKSGALGGNTLVSNNDELGHISFQGSDGTEFVTGASITAEVDGTAAANDMPGRLVFYTTPDATAVQTEKFRITQGGVRAFRQQTPASFVGAGTLNNANLFTGIIDYTGALATLTLPLGTTLETAFNNTYVDIAFEWSVINRGSGTVTIGANTGSTVLGSGAVVVGASGRFVTRRTAANTFVTYRLA